MITSPHTLTAVIGATGTVGAPCVAALARFGQVRAVARRLPDRPAPGRAVMVDFRSEADLGRALRNVEAMVLALGTTPDLPELEARVLAAALENGVKRIIRISAPDVPGVTVSTWHQRCEAQLLASGIPNVNLRPAAFMQNWLRRAIPIRMAGVVPSSAGDAGRNYVDARDVAEVAARLVRDGAFETGQSIEVTGPEALSDGDVVRRLTAVTGQSVRCQTMPPEAHRAMLIQRGMPDWLAEHVVELDLLALARSETGTTMLDDWLAQPARTFDEFLAEQRNAFAPAGVRGLMARWKRGGKGKT